ncbi:hypothetical protein F383_22676 [Gossypium arboreum]|uniref:Uncharacterized protein n=1 Tax=Gossypium arboreum TaxID=29729 RepID=A0A0B0NX90_GOSAR|nr:hypothetical protein F383_22676 [Gossypium arboreum]
MASHTPIHETVWSILTSF